jgi:hypothetical protein
MSNTYFADFHSRWLTGDQIIDEADLVKAATPAAPPSYSSGLPTQETTENSVATIVSELKKSKEGG